MHRAVHDVNEAVCSRRDKSQVKKETERRERRERHRETEAFLAEWPTLRKRWSMPPHHATLGLLAFLFATHVWRLTESACCLLALILEHGHRPGRRDQDVVPAGTGSRSSLRAVPKVVGGYGASHCESGGKLLLNAACPWIFHETRCQDSVKSL
jgi:hypothetical protein